MFFKSKNFSPKITGNYDFYVETTIKGNLPYQTSKILIHIYENSSKKKKIEMNTNWVRLKENKEFLIKGMKNQLFYNFSSEDIGSIIKITISSENSHKKGKCLINVGPIKIDPNVSSTVESILNTGGTKFPISLINKNQNEFSAYNNQVNILNLNYVISFFK